MKILHYLIVFTAVFFIESSLAGAVTKYVGNDDAGDPSEGCPDMSGGTNPIHIVSGNNFYSHELVPKTREGGANFSVYYNSKFIWPDGGITARWSYSYNQYVMFEGFEQGQKVIYRAEDGSEHVFYDNTYRRNLETLISSPAPDTDVVIALSPFKNHTVHPLSSKLSARYNYQCGISENGRKHVCKPVSYAGFIYQRSNGDIEEFKIASDIDELGVVTFSQEMAFLTNITTMNGVETQIAWSNVDPSGELSGAYNNTIFAKVTDPFNNNLIISKEFNGQAPPIAEYENSYISSVKQGEAHWNMTVKPFHPSCGDANQQLYGRLLGGITGPKGREISVIHGFLYNGLPYTDVSGRCDLLESVFENGSPYKNWGYNSAGDAVVSYRGGVGSLGSIYKYKRLGDPLFGHGAFPQKGIDDVKRIGNIDDYSRIDVDPHNLRVVENQLGHQTTYDITSGKDKGDWENTVKMGSISGGGSSSCVPTNASYVYDVNGDLDSIDRDGVITEYDFRNINIMGDFPGMVTRKTHAKNTPLEYTETFRSVAYYRLDNKVWSNEGLYFFPEPRQKKLRGLTIDYEYYPDHRRIKKRTETDTTTHTVPYTTAGKQRVWAYVYDLYPSGAVQKRTVSNPDNTIDVHEYYADGNLKSVESGAEKYTFSEYNSFGLPEKVTNTNGLETTIAYINGHDGYLISSVTFNGETTHYDYSPHSVLEKVRYPNGLELTYKFNAAKKLESITDNAGNNIQVTVTDSILGAAHNGNGTRTRKVEYKDADGQVVFANESVQNSLFKLHKVISQVPNASDNSISMKEYLYDESGDQVKTIDHNASYIDSSGNKKRGNLQTTKVYDVLDRITSVLVTVPADQDTLLKEVEYGYDDYGNQDLVKDGRGVETKYVFNGWGEVIQEESTATGKTIYEYDGGLLKKKTHADSSVKSYQYSKGRLRKVTTIGPAGTTVTEYGYDAFSNDANNLNYGKGKQTSSSTEASSEVYQYDQFGNVYNKSVSIGGMNYNSGYKYDDYGQLSEMLYPNSVTLNYVRDDKGFLRSIEIKGNALSNAQVLVSDIKYNPFAGVSEYTLGNGIKHVISRDKNGSVSLIESSYGNTKVSSLDYHFDAGNIYTIIDNVSNAQSQSFDYNIKGMLAKASGAYGDISYKYDESLNRKSKQENSVLETYQYPNDSNRLSWVDRKVDGTTERRSFQYDLMGNIYQDSHFSTEASANYIYDQNNQLIEMSRSVSPGSAVMTPVARYGYNAKGQRVVKETAEQQWEGKHFHYDQQGKIISITNKDGVVLEEYYYLEDQMVAMKRNEDLDEDGLLDSWEVKYFGSLVKTADGDEDGDGINNLTELKDKTDPMDDRSGGTEDDLDGDGMPDSWEIKHFATISRDGTGDFDNDGVTDAAEFTAGSSPTFNIAWFIPVLSITLN